MPPRSRLSREEEGKGIATDSPLDDFDLIHRDALRDTENMTLSQRLLVAGAHRIIRDEGADRVEVGSSDVSSSGSEASSQTSRPLRRNRRGVPFDQVDCRPTIYHPGGIFEELSPLPPELLRDPRAQSWGNAIAAHCHLCWPDLSREWIRRQEARIARVDWESRLPVVLGPRKSRRSLFTRKQQKLLDEARKMDRVPDLRALLKGKLQLLSKKSTPANVQGSTSSDGDRASKERAPDLVNEGVGAELSASSPKKKKKRRKRPYEGATSSVDHGEAPAVGREGAAEDPVETNPSEGVPEDRPRKKKNKRSIEAEPRPSGVEAALVDVVTRDGVSPETPPKKRKVSTRGSGSVASERSAPDPSARKGSRSEGSIVKRGRIEFPDRVEFSYDETTPLILNPLRCAELTRQIRGRTRKMPQLEDLYFKNEYIDAASSRARSDGSMNFLVEKYDSALKQTMIQLGSSEKLAQARLKAIERVREEHKKANEKAAKEKEILRVKFEELEGKLKSARAARKELTRDNTSLEQEAANLEKEKTELLEERDAAVEKLIRERQRLRDSQGLEVTREREKVEAAMIEKENRCFGCVRDHFTRLEAFGKAKNLYGQASGTKKCLEMIRASRTEIPQEMSDVFAEQEKLYEAEATKLCVGLLSDSDLTLSPLGLPSRFVEDKFRESFDPYGSNVNLIRPETASQLITSLEITEEPTKEPLVDVTSVPAEHVEVPEGGGLEEVPGRDNLETDDTPIREEETQNEDDKVGETSPPQPVEEETANEVVDRDVPPHPAVDSLVPVSTRVGDPTAAAAEDPDDQDSVP
ncbi:hypothetical protein DY000_02024556 [Brassica cretica]|uniref:Uncharacterized protein n=1 Tax=Brassica cretica TaxID=69181 RepID=A0ABQ7ECH4_BRACR|nr:hypothetical protein DY000_02024556 [Brassica cretica]